MLLKNTVHKLFQVGMCVCVCVFVFGVGGIALSIIGTNS